jgi:antitoxin MazE
MWKRYLRAEDRSGTRHHLFAGNPLHVTLLELEKTPLCFVCPGRIPLGFRELRTFALGAEDDVASQCQPFGGGQGLGRPENLFARHRQHITLSGLTGLMTRRILFVATEARMHSRVQKWGNSLAVRIPKPFASEIGLARDAEVEITVSEGKLIVSPCETPSYSLEELLSGVRKSNLHTEVFTGPAKGREVW